MKKLGLILILPVMLCMAGCGALSKLLNDGYVETFYFSSQFVSGNSLLGVRESLHSFRSNFSGADYTLMFIDRITKQENVITVISIPEARIGWPDLLAAEANKTQDLFFTLTDAYTSWFLDLFNTQGTKIQRINLSKKPQTAHWNPDGSMIAVSYADGGIEIYNTTGTRLNQIEGGHHFIWKNTQEGFYLNSGTHLAHYNLTSNQETVISDSPVWPIQYNSETNIIYGATDNIVTEVNLGASPITLQTQTLNFVTKNYSITTISLDGNQVLIKDSDPAGGKGGTENFIYNISIIDRTENILKKIKERFTQKEYPNHD